VKKIIINIISEKWMLTEGGEQFLKDNSILRIEEDEEYDFLLDGISGEVISSKENQTERQPQVAKYICHSELKLAIKSPDLLENKFQVNWLMFTRSENEQ
jgi:hypothetical protein